MRRSFVIMVLQDFHRQRNAIMTFLGKFSDRISGVISCFDRMDFKGYLPLGYAKGMEGFLFRWVARPNMAGSRSEKKLPHRRPLSIENLPTGLSLREWLLVPAAPTRFSGGPPCGRLKRRLARPCLAGSLSDRKPHHRCPTQIETSLKIQSPREWLLVPSVRNGRERTVAIDWYGNSKSEITNLKQIQMSEIRMNAHRVGFR